MKICFGIILISILAIQQGYSGCAVSNPCKGGGSVSCTGDCECNQLSGGVSCDGKQTCCQQL